MFRLLTFQMLGRHMGLVASRLDPAVWPLTDFSSPIVFLPSLQDTPDPPLWASGLGVGEDVAER